MAQQQVRTYVEALCWKCLQRSCYRIIDMLCMVRDERGKIYTQEGVNHDRYVLANIFLCGDRLSVRQKIFQFFWQQPDKFNNPVFKHAIIVMLEFILLSRLKDCKNRSHSKYGKDINFDDLVALGDDGMSSMKFRNFMSTGNLSEML